jgi:hypothetical protein
VTNALRTSVGFALTALGALGLLDCTEAPSVFRGMDGATPGVDAAADAPATEQPAPPTEAPARPTWWRDVLPLVQSRCVECHVSGGIAPFALDTYESARERAPLMVVETRMGRMPPWPPSDDCRPLQHVRRLSARELAVLENWSRAGTPEGDRGTYVRPADAREPFPTTVDFTAQPAAPYTPPARAVDDYRCFVVNPGWTEAKHLVQARITPGDARIVHHLNMFEVRAASVAELEALDARSAGEGYPCFGGVGIPVGSLADQRVQYVAGWAPGSPALRTPPGTGIRMEPGSRLVLQVHYNQSVVQGASDRTRVEMVFSPTPPRRQAMVIPVMADHFRIPAGMPDYPVENSLQPRALGITFPVTVYGAFPHMHQFARAAQSTLTRADGSRECLVDVPRWQFHWQQFYMFDEPVRVEPDDRVTVQCRYDNSPANQPVVNGVQRTPQEVRSGTGTLDEMCMTFFYITIL